MDIKRLIRVAQGLEPADLVLKNAEVFEYTASSDWTSMFAVKANSILSGSADSQIIGKLLANYNSAPRMMYLYGEE